MRLAGRRVTGWIVLALCVWPACGEDAPKRDTAQLQRPIEAPPEAPKVERVEPTLANAMAQKTRDPIAVRVMSSIVTSTFTYLEAADDSGRGWVVTPALTVDNDAQVIVSNYVLTREVELPDSKLRFEQILVAASVSGTGVTLSETGEEAAVDPMLLADNVTRAEASIELTAFDKADYTVAEVFEKREQLADKRIKVRGQVIRMAARVGNRNWVWLRDGTGQAWSSLLPVPIDQPADLGQVLLVEGRVVPDRSFPLGGTHDVILEEAAVLGGAGSAPALKREGSPLPGPEVLERIERSDRAARAPATATATAAP